MDLKWDKENANVILSVDVYDAFLSSNHIWVGF